MPIDRRRFTGLMAGLAGALALPRRADAELLHSSPHLAKLGSMTADVEPIGEAERAARRERARRLEETKATIYTLPKATRRAVERARRTWPEAQLEDFQREHKNFVHKETGVRYRRVPGDALLGGAQEQQVTARLVATNAAHLPDAEAAGNPGGGLMYRMPSQPSIDGNTVDPQAEYAQFAQNALQYQSSLTFLSGRIKTLLTAIRGD